MPGITAVSPAEVEARGLTEAAVVAAAREVERKAEQRRVRNAGVSPFLGLAEKVRESFKERKPLEAGTFRGPSLTARVSKP